MYGILDKKRGIIHTLTTGKKRFEDKLEREFWEGKGNRDFNQAKFMEGKVRVKVTIVELDG